MPKNPWARNPWFESVAVAQRRARQRLPSSVYGALVAGSERGQSSHDNTAAFAELGFAPHVVGPSTERLLGTTVMGQDVSLPVLISPTGVQAVHPDGEVAMARAAAARDTVMGLSSFASRPVEEVVAANPKTLFQIYWMGSRDLMLERLQRARGAGAKGLIATLDWSFSMGRDWGSPEIPERLDVAAMVRFAPQVLIRPRWLWDFARSGQIPDLTAPNLARDGGDAPTFFGAYYEWMQTPAPTWDDVEWLRASWDGPFMLKGVCRIDDARGPSQPAAPRSPSPTTAATTSTGHPRRSGCSARSPTLSETRSRCCSTAACVAARTWSKALCLGARAVMIGRASLWGLAANGQAGVENVLDILRGGVESALLALRVPSIHELRPEHLIIPDGFHRRLGAGPAAE